MYNYRARLVRIVDADTLVLDIDQGLETVRRITVRLALVDAVEKSDPLHGLAGNLVEQFINDNMDDRGCINISTFKDKREKYGRYLVTIHARTPGETDLNHELVKSGYAVYKNY